MIDHLIDHPPLGALTEKERMRLYDKSFQSSWKWCGKKGYYAVLRGNGELSIGGTRDSKDGAFHSYSFSWTPATAYYFTNYWFALAYSLRVKHDQHTERTQ